MKKYLIVLAAAELDVGWLYRITWLVMTTSKLASEKGRCPQLSRLASCLLVTVS